MLRVFFSLIGYFLYLHLRFFFLFLISKTGVENKIKVTMFVYPA